MAAGSLVAASFTAVTAGSAQAVTHAAARSSSGFTVYDGTRTTPILMDAGYEGDHGDRDYTQVRRAVQDLRQDVAMVTGGIDAHAVQSLLADDENAEAARLDGADPARVPALLTSATPQRTAIIVGEVGQSPLIDRIVKAGKFDEAAGIRGKWEAYATKTIKDPLPGVDRALVIAGSDARGTIYGTYSISEEIGVSPWYWFSDVPVQRQTTVAVKGKTHVEEGPSVKYRGFFINDEERTLAWARKKFPTADGTVDVNYYRHVFELILRLRLDTLWPAMHGAGTAFNAATDTGTYDDGTPVNAQEAAEYGVIASTSHAEPMLRNNEGEWRQWYTANKTKYDIKGSDSNAAYDYSINKPAILQYWRERIEANSDFESIIVLGIRGVSDNNAAFTADNPYGFKDKVEMEADVIREQRRIIADTYGAEDAVPQVFIPYKEMNDLYNQGLKKYIPADVTLMWAEDNYGYLRQVPTQTEAARAGGNGVYYHVSYWGEPKSYLWLNSTPMSLMVQQLHRAWSSGVQRYWVLNVGDIKPGDMKLELFSKLAWDVDGYDDTNIESTFLTQDVERDYGLHGKNARTVADALGRFDTLESTKRAEFWGEVNTSSATSGRIHDGEVFPFSATSDGDELQRYIDESDDLVRILQGVSAKLDPSYRAAFYEQVLYRVRSYRNMAEQIGYYEKNQLAASQGRYASAGSYELLSKAARDRIFTDEQTWNALSDGKWAGIIGHSHPEGFPNEGTVMLTNDRYARVEKPVAGVGAAAEGGMEPGAGTLRFDAAAPDDERFFDVFNRDDVASPHGWVAETDASWLTLSRRSGTVATEQRVVVTVGKQHPAATATIRVFDAVRGKKSGDPVATFTVVSERPVVDLHRVKGPVHLEANGYVALEAEHFSSNVRGADGSRWAAQQGVGQRGSVMGSYPETAPRVDDGFEKTARLTYRVYFRSTGTFTGTFYRVPTLNEGTNDDGTAKTARTAVGLDDATPTLLRGNSVAGTSTSPWGFNIMHGTEPLDFTVDVKTAGWHDLTVYRSDAAILFDRIVIETRAGAVGDGLVGPTESPNTVAAAQKATVAALPSNLPALHRLAPVETTVGATAAVDGVVGGVASAESDNTTAATVSVDDGKLSVTGRRVGKAEVSVTDTDGEAWVLSVTVDRGAVTSTGPYVEKGGLVVVDTADALEESASARTTDGNDGVHTWTLARNGLQVVPPADASAKANWIATTPAQGDALLAAGPKDVLNGSTASGAPPRLDFQVDIRTAGTYYLFVNSSHPNDNADSYHVAVDGTWRYQSGKTSPETGSETWYGSVGVDGAALKLSAGVHTVTLAAREAGIVLNQVALTTSTSPGFSGFRPTSSRATATPPHGLPASSTTVGASVTVEGVTGAASAAASDNPTAATVAVSDGKATVTGRRVGTAEITVADADGGLWALPVTVHRSASAPTGAFVERGGLVVLDVADALEESESARTTDGNDGVHTWALGRNGLQVVPPAISSAKAQWLATTPAEGEALLEAGSSDEVNGSTAAGAPPQLTFRVDVGTGGTYYLFVNSSHPNGDADSYHVVVDGSWRYQSGKSAPETGFESWYGSTGTAGAGLDLTPGLHTVTLAAREAGIVLNQVALTTSTSPGLAGFLPVSGREAS
ncbi:glycosyl hydrolase 115 family protein [Luteimicrobium sp. NPDC057192]|uniref:glycosyl hydrolase 115 family protein n=1 Tax=Luteimicrobium sp. NPDC057192 TaxID=3346042 RepID=UPI003644B249